MEILTHAKFHFNRLMLTLIFGTRAWRTTEKAAHDRVKDGHFELSTIKPFWTFW